MCISKLATKHVGTNQDQALAIVTQTVMKKAKYYYAKNLLRLNKKTTTVLLLVKFCLLRIHQCFTVQIDSPGVYLNLCTWAWSFLIDIIMIISEYHAYKTIWTLFIINLNSLSAAYQLSGMVLSYSVYVHMYIHEYNYVCITYVHN